MNSRCNTDPSTAHRAWRPTWRSTWRACPTLALTALLAGCGAHGSDTHRSAGLASKAPAAPTVAAPKLATPSFSEEYANALRGMEGLPAEPSPPSF